MDQPGARHALPTERAGRPAPAELAEQRATIASGVAERVWTNQVKPIADTVDGVRVLRFRPAGSLKGRVLHLHSGGFCLGSPEMIAPYAAALAERCAVEVVCPAYRLAPEHPFPAGLADALKVYAALRRDGPVIVAGDSAGGGLAASVAAKLAAEGASPVGLAVLSPWLDVTCEADAYSRNAEVDPLFARAAAQMMAEFYLQGAPADHPLASPVFADVAGFPPTFLNVGDGEVLTDDTRTLARRLAAAGVDVTVLEVEGMEHVAVTRDFALLGAVETFDALAAFIDRLTSKTV